MPEKAGGFGDQGHQGPMEEMKGMKGMKGMQGVRRGMKGIARLKCLAFLSSIAWRPGASPARAQCSAAKITQVNLGG